MRKEHLILRRHDYENNSGKVDLYLKGYIQGCYDSKKYGSALAKSYLTVDDEINHEWTPGGFHLTTTGYFTTISDICKYNAMAIINIHHECEFVRELCRLKLKFREPIVIRIKTVSASQIKRLGI